MIIFSIIGILFIFVLIYLGVSKIIEKYDEYSKLKKEKTGGNAK